MEGHAKARKRRGGIERQRVEGVERQGVGSKGLRSLKGKGSGLSKVRIGVVEKAFDGGEARDGCQG